MSAITLRELQPEDKEQFISAAHNSQSLHHPWVRAPVTSQEFDDYFTKFQQPNQKSYLLRESGHLVGVFNVTEIVRGIFQNAYLGFYVFSEYAGKGFMKDGLKLLLSKVFKDLGLHRLEANIQPENKSSLHLVKNAGFRYEGFSPRYLKINDEWRGHEHWAITFEDYVRDEADIVNQDVIEIVSYNPTWEQMAQNEIEKLKTYLPAEKIIDIAHVGSTAIPGLSAKPIIDLQIGAHSLDEMKVLAVPILQKLGYEYWEDNPDPEKMFFVKGMPPYGERRTHHVHIFKHNSKHWRNKLLFRDYLRANPEVAKEYNKIKIKLAKEHALDREKYTDEKLLFVKKVLKLAKMIK